LLFLQLACKTLTTIQCSNCQVLTIYGQIFLLYPLKICEYYVHFKNRNEKLRHFLPFFEKVFDIFSTNSTRRRCSYFAFVTEICVANFSLVTQKHGVQGFSAYLILWHLLLAGKYSGQSQPLHNMLLELTC
jgi:hypothetical protein